MPSCKKCNGTKSYMYDEIHSTVCDECCAHDQGWFLLGEGHGVDAGRLCCKAGCGHLSHAKPESTECINPDCMKNMEMFLNEHSENVRLFFENERLREALSLIASSMRPDGTWNRDRQACMELAREALERE